MAKASGIDGRFEGYEGAAITAYGEIPCIPLYPDQDNELCKQRLRQILLDLQCVEQPRFEGDAVLLLHYLVLGELLSLGDEQTRSRLRESIHRGQSSFDPQGSSVGGGFECVENGVGKKVEKNIPQGE